MSTEPNITKDLLHELLRDFAKEYRAVQLNNYKDGSSEVFDCYEN